MRKLLFVIVITTFSLLFAKGCNSCSSCSNGMCTIPGAKMTESEVRARASIFAYNRLVARQQSGAPITDENNQIFTPQPIEQQSWKVTLNDDKWLLKRHLTRDFWQVVECNLDGSKADCFYEIGPTGP